MEINAVTLHKPVKSQGMCVVIKAKNDIRVSDFFFMVR